MATGERSGDGREAAAVQGAHLRSAREAAGLSLSQLATRLNYSRAALGHYETGARGTPPDIALWYERICGEYTDPVAAVTALGRADVDRRSFLFKAAYTTALSATALGALDAGRLVATGATRTVGMGEVDAVRAVTAAFLSLDEARGGGIGRTAVAEFLVTDVADVLRSRFANATIRAEAFSAAAELAYLAAFKAHDAGQDGVAQRYYLAALRLAEQSGNPAQEAWVLRALALQGVDIRQRRFSVDLVEEAVRRAHGKLGADAAALFTVGLARCHAESGNRAQALAVLRDAQGVITADLTDPAPRWIAMWCPNKATVVDQAAKAFSALGEHGEAQRLFVLGASIWNPGTHARVHALTCADAGLAQWKTGDDSGAAALWTSIIPVLQRVQSARTAKALDKIRRHAPELVTTAAV
ncbi:helix-turn-helix domain-containing protein [Nocardia wallacei]|uniref:helix-turn-helix domain-containing protein n=1 Tax=Nocardia wallacei TaxID=480035 RepID=UPI002458C46C|nr:helix-turn-helix transcriptional regulator [Nocardia wallacei]